MNRSFRCIWSRVRHCIVVVAETVRAHGKERSSVRLVVRALVRDSQHSDHYPNAPPDLKTFARLMAAAGLLSFSPFFALAAPDVNQLPTNGQVVAGQASINTGGATNAPVMTINQSTNRAVINWSGHDIGANAQVNYVVPNASSSTLSRVTSGNPTQIFGRLTSNGQLFLTNSSGILFGRTASVDVGALVATTHSIGNEDFMAGRLRFSREGATGSVVNEGEIKAALNGYIALLAPEVKNEGVIVAQMGTVALAAGEAFELNINDKSLASIRVEPATIKTLVENKHAVQAPGGLIILSSRAQSEILGGVVKQSGELIASSITERGGRILLEGDDITLTATSKIEATGATRGGEVLVGGDWQGGANAERRVFVDPNAMHQATRVTMESGATIDASATDNGKGGTVVLWSDITNPNSITSAHGSIYAKGGTNGGDGGQIETSGHLLVTDGVQGSAAATKGQAGEWLFDPTNITIGSSGNTAAATNNGSSVSATTVSTLLNGGTSVTVTTQSAGGDLGDITVNAGISKTSGDGDVTLKLRAANSIIVQSSITRSGTGTGRLNIWLDADNDTSATTSDTSPVRNGGGIVILENSLSSGGGFIRFGGTASGSNTGGDLYVSSSSNVTIDTRNTVGGTFGGMIDVKGQLILGMTTGSTLSMQSGGGNVSIAGSIDSGNSYGFVSYTSGGSWLNAAQEAKSGTNGGAAVGDSYLISITSRLENSIATYRAGYRGAWIGAYRDPSTLSWFWVGGAEAGGTYAVNGASPFTKVTGASGSSFFSQASGSQQNTAGGWANGSLTAQGSFQNFGQGEPNGTGGGENVGQFFGSVGLWNDLAQATTYSTSTSQYAVWGFVRETNLAPSALTLNAGVGSVTIGGAVGGSKEISNLNITAGTLSAGAVKASSAVNISVSGESAITGVVSGSASLTKSGTGVLTLRGVNTYTGSTTINAGTLAIADSAKIYRPGYGIANTITINQGAVLDIKSWDWEGSLGTLLYDQANLVINGGTIRQSGASSNSAAGTNMSSRQFTIGTGGATFESSNSGVTWTIDRDSRANYQLATTGDITFAGAGNIVMNVWLSGSGTLTSNSTGTVTLGGSNTYTGGTTISGGVVKLGVSTSGTVTNGPLGTNTVTVNSGAAIDLNGRTIANALNISGTGVSLGGVLFNSTSTTSTISGAVTLSGNSTIKGNNGALTISGTVNGAYELTINTTNTVFTQSGIVGGSGALTGYTVNSGTGNVALNNAINVAGPVSVYGGNIDVTANLTSTAATGTGILLSGQKIVHASGVTVSSQGSNIDYVANGASAVATTDYALQIGDFAGSKATINANGGAVNLAGTYGAGGTAATVSTNGDRAVFIHTAEILTSGSGTINIAGDATNNPNTTATAWGLILYGSLVQTVTGAISITGTGGKSTSNSRGLVVGDTSKILSLSGHITLKDLAPTGLTGSYLGLYSNKSLTVGSDGTLVASSHSPVTITADKLTFETTTSTVRTAGAVVVESNGNSFNTNPVLSALSVLGNPSAVRIGKATNTANITLANELVAAGSITVYGGAVSLNAGVSSSSSSGNGISINGQSITQAAGVTVSTSGANISYTAAGMATTANNDNVMFIGAYDGNRATINANGGNISLSGAYGATGQAGGVDFAVQIVGTDVLTSGAGSISITGDGTNTTTTDTVFGLHIGRDTLFRSNTGAITLTGIAGKASVNSRGLVADQQSFKVLSASGLITLKDLQPQGVISPYAYSGAYLRPGNGGSIFVGSDGVTVLSGSSTASSSNIIIQSDRLTIESSQSGGHTLRLNTSGTVTVESISDSFATAFTWPPSNLNVGSTLGGLTIGKATNTANITIVSNQTVNGPVNIYGGSVVLDGAITTQSSTTGDVNIVATGVSGSGGITLADGRALSITQSGTSVYAGVITGANATLTKDGTGRLNLTAANTFTGGTTVAAGALGLYSNSAAGTGAITFADNTTLLLGRAVTEIANGVTLNGAVTVDLDTAVDYLIVGGGGGGGAHVGGGGGGGGVLTGTLQATLTSYAVSVGGGGVGGRIAVANDWAGAPTAQNGQVSSFAGSTALGGGGGGQWNYREPNQNNNGQAVASGGGSGDATLGGPGTAGQGYAGGKGDGIDSYGYQAGGGGGAGGTGGDFNYSTGGTGTGGSGRGGVGAYVGWADAAGLGQNGYFGGGGGGGLHTQMANYSAGSGGLGGGGAGSEYSSTATSGTSNTGGGGGGAGLPSNMLSTGGSGGSGLVAVRYLGSSSGSGGTVSNGSGSNTGYTLHTFTTVGSSTLSLNALDVVLSGKISGAGNLTANASNGTLTLSGANDYTGTTTITGLVKTNNATALGSNSAVTLATSAGTQLQLVQNLTVGSIAGGSGTNSQINLGDKKLTTGANNSSTTFAGRIYGTGGVLEKAGSGTLTLSGDNTYTGGTNINSGTLNLGSSSAIGGAGIISFGGGTLQYSAINTNDYSARFSSVDNQAYRIDTNAQNVTLAAALTSAGGTLTKSGTGTLTLTGTNTFAGGTTISSGTLQIGAGGTTGSIGNQAVTNNGALTFNRSDDTTFSGDISGTGSVTKSGFGVLTFDGSNTFSGGVSLAAGSLNLGSTQAIGSVGTISFSGGALRYSSNNTTDYSSRFASTANQAFKIDTNGENISFASTLASSGATLVKLGTGDLTLTAATYTGATTINGGRLVIESDTALLTSSNYSGAGTLLIQPSSASFSSAVTLTAGQLGSLGGLTIGKSGNTTAITVNSDITLDGALTVYGPLTLGGSITSAGVQSYNGDVTIGAATVSLSTMGGSSTGSDITFSGNINGATANSNSLFMLSGTGAISVGGNVGSSAALRYLGLGGTGQYIPSQAWNFAYTGAEQTFTATYTGTYQLEVWGAEGGSGDSTSTSSNAAGGKGGFSSGQMSYNAGQVLYLSVGGQGQSGSGIGGDSLGGWNGGGSGQGYSNDRGGGGGGGATHIATASGLLSSLSSNQSAVLIVAGGGGGGGPDPADYGGAGGGTSGQDGYINNGGGAGGTQNQGGFSYSDNRVTVVGQGVFGQGDNARTDRGNGGGGGGWYGGGAGDYNGGGGGSAYVGGVVNGSTIAGNASMPNPLGSTMIGRTGNGYARITRAETTVFNAGTQTGSVSIAGGINAMSVGTAGTAYDLALATSSGNVTIGSSATFNNTGTLKLGSGSGTQTVSVTGALTATAPSEVKIGANVTTATTQAYGAAELLRDITLATTNSAVSFNGTLDSEVSEANALTVNAGSGAITLSGAAGATVDLGAVTLNSTGATTIGGSVTAASVTTNSGGTLALNGGAITTTGNQSYGEAITLGANTTLTAADITAAAINLSTRNLTTDVTGSSSAISGVISGSGTLTKSGTGTLTLSDANTYTGATTINAGSLVIQSNAPTTGSSSFGGAGTLTIQPVANDFTSTFSTSSWTFGSTLGGLTIGKASSADGTSDQGVTIASNISIAGPVTVFGRDITINSTRQVTAGANQNIVLVASNDFINNSGASALTTSGTGRWIVYAADGGASGNTYGNLNSNNEAVWGSTYATLAPGSVASGNRYVFAQPASTDVTVTTVDLSKVYGTLVNLNTAGASYLQPYSITSSGGVTAVSGAYLGTTGTTPTLSDVFSTLPTFAATNTAATASVGSANITIINGTARSGYNVTYQAGSSYGQLTVTQRPITVTAAAKTKVYGDSDPSLTYTLEAAGTSRGLISGDTFTGSLARAVGENVGGYAINQGTVANSNYAITYVGADLTITPRTVSLSATKTYDGSTSLTGSQVTIGNLVNSETLTYTGAVANSKHVAGADGNTATADNFIGAITLANATDASGGLASNYQLPTLNVANAPVTITAKTLTPTVSNTGVTKVYDGTTAAPDGFTPTYTFSGLIGGDSAAVLTNTGAVYNSATVAGANQITVSGLGISSITGTNGSQATDYALDATSKAVAASISRATLTVTADNKSRIYGDANPTFSQTITGYVNGENATSAGVTGSALGSTTATSATDVGSYTITGSTGTLSAANYSFSAANGILTIGQRAITLTANNQSKTYGDALVLGTSAFSLTTGSFATGELATSALLSSSSGYAASTTQAVGSYANDILIAGATGTGGFNASNYNISYTPGSLTINARPVTVTATAKTKVYGEADPSLTYSIAADGVGTSRGLANSETLTGALTRAAGEVVDTYAISQGGLTNANNSNYAITYVADNLTVTRRPITLTANAATKIYGDTDPTLSVSASASGAGVGIATTANGNTVNDTLADITGTLSRQAGSNVGAYDIALGSGSKSANYDITFAADNNAFTITPRTVTLSATKTYDGSAALTGSQVTIGNLANSETLAYTGAVANSKHVAGADGNTATADNFISAITLANATDASGGLASNYQLPTLNVANAPVTITPLAVTLAAPAVSKTYDGNTSYATTAADLTSIAGSALVGGDTVTAATMTYDNRHVGSGNKTVSLDSVTISSGNSNYIINRGSNTSSTITQLTSATWVGGNGNWADANNWAVTGNASQTGVLPDGANVALAIIPAGFAGTVTSNTTHGHTGKIQISGGTLSVSADSHLGATPNATVSDLITLNGGKLSATADFAIDSKRGVLLGANGGTFQTDASVSLNYAGVIAGTGGLTKSGSGTLSVTGTNTYSGATTINGGVLSIVADTNLGAAPGTETADKLVIQNGGTLQLAVQAGEFQNFLTLNSNRGLTLGAGGGQIEVLSNVEATYGGVVAGSGSFTKSGVGQLNFASQNNTYAGGTNVVNGMLFGGAGSLDSTVFGSGNVTINSGARLWIDRSNLSNSLTLNGGTLVGTNGFGEIWSGPINITAESTVDVGSYMTLSNSITGSGKLVVKTGQVTITGSAAHTGGTEIRDSGKLYIGSGGTTGSMVGDIATTADTLVVFNHSSNTSYAGVISGLGSLEKRGAGVLTLTSNQTHTGATTVSTGSLVLSNDAPTTGSSSFGGAGQLYIQSAGDSFASPFNTSGFAFASDLGGLRLGKSTNTANVTLSSPLSIAGSLTIYGGKVLFNGTTLGGNLAVTTRGSGAQGGVSQADGTSITVSGTSTFTADTGADQIALLNSTSNNFGGTVSFQGSNSGNWKDVTLRDVNTLTLGNVTVTGKLDTAAGSGIEVTGAVNSAELTLGMQGSAADITVNAAIDQPGDITIFGRNVTLGAGLTVGSDRSVIISASNNFLNDVGANALTVSGAGRWIVYAGKALGNTYNNLDSQNTAVWNASYTTLPPVDVPSGNRYVFNQDPIRSAIITTTSASKVYGDAINLGSNYTLTSPGIAAVSGAYLGTNDPIDVSLNDVFTANPIGSTASAATALVGTAEITAATGYARDSFSVTYNNEGVLTVNRRPIELTADASSKIYGSANPSYTVSITGGTVATSAGDTLADVTGTLTRTSGENAGVYDILLGTGAKAGNYSITFNASNQAFTINKANLGATGNKVYNGSALFDATDLTVSGVNGETFTASGYATLASKNVLADAQGDLITQNPVSLSGLSLSPVGSASLSNYNDLTLAQTAVTISKRDVTLSATGFSKTYDGTKLHDTRSEDLTNLSKQLLDGVLGIDSVSAATIEYASKNVGTDIAISIDPNSVKIDDGNGGKNYTVTIGSSGKGTITKAPLTVRATSDADFVTQADSRANYGGVIYSGFVAGESAANLSAAEFTAGSVTRNRTAGDTAAGTYSGVLAPSGFTAANYNITPVAGDYTIVPANVLMVRVNPATAQYSAAAPSYSVSASYLTSNNTVTSVATSVASGKYVANVDGGSRAEFNISAVGTTRSSAGYLVVGGYNLAAGDVSLTAGANPTFNQVVLVGGMQITPKTLSTDLGIQSVSKTYDGNATIVGSVLDFSKSVSGVLAADAVTIQGVGSFVDRHVGQNKAVNLNMALRGADAPNYALASTSLTQNIGTITQRAEVRYVGASGGDWSNAKNWADGAIPDAGNVARIVIPQGLSTVYDRDNFGTTTAAIDTNGTIRISASQSFDLSNTVTGSGVLAQAGLGTLTVSGANSGFTGSLDLGSGQVVISNANALGASPRVSSTGGRLNIASGLVLPSLTINGASTVISAIKTRGDQLYNGSLTFLSSGVSGVAGGANFDSSAGSITFNGAVSAGAGSKSAERSLVVSAPNGSVTVNDQIGVAVVDRSRPDYQTIRWGSYIGTTGTNPWAVDISAASILLKADVTSFETQRYSGPVRIGNNGTNGRTRLLVSLDPAITFLDSVDDTTEGQHTLVLRAVSTVPGQTPTISTQDIGKNLALAGFDARVGRQWTDGNVADIGNTPDAPRVYSDSARESFVGGIDIGGSVVTTGDQFYAGDTIAFSGQSAILRSTLGAIETVWGLTGANPNLNVDLSGISSVQTTRKGKGAGDNLASALASQGKSVEIDKVLTLDAGQLTQQKGEFTRVRQLELLEQRQDSTTAQVEIGRLEDASGTMIRVSAIDGAILTEAVNPESKLSDKPAVECTDRVSAENTTEDCR